MSIRDDLNCSSTKNSPELTKISSIIKNLFNTVFEQPEKDIWNMVSMQLK